MINSGSLNELAKRNVANKVAPTVSKLNDSVVLKTTKIIAPKPRQKHRANGLINKLKKKVKEARSGKKTDKICQIWASTQELGGGVK